MQEGLKKGLLAWKTRAGVLATLDCISPKTNKPVKGCYILTPAGVSLFAQLLP
jgi:hypothetical protein